MIYKQLAEMEDGFQIDIHHQIPVLRADLGDVAAQPDPGVIHQNVGFTQSVDTGGKQIFPALFVREIGFDRDDLYVRAGLHRFDQPFGMLFLTHIGKADIDAFFGERKNKLSPQAGCAACHDGRTIR
ncbi:Uncharacterised protein [Klebsiella pneumoniae]|nr:Uncharacterised protein [Klebsiella pneumoniae]